MLPLHVQVRNEYAAKANSLVSELQTFRSQLELYKLQHDDKLPDFKTHGWSELIKATNAAGETGKGDCGPYLQQAPINPLNGQSRILLTHKPLKQGFTYSKGDCGFVIDDTTGKVWASPPTARSSTNASTRPPAPPSPTPASPASPPALIPHNGQRTNKKGGPVTGPALLF